MTDRRAVSNLVALMAVAAASALLTSATVSVAAEFGCNADRECQHGAQCIATSAIVGHEGESDHTCAKRLTPSLTVYSFCMFRLAWFTRFNVPNTLSDSCSLALDGEISQLEPRALAGLLAGRATSGKTVSIDYLKIRSNGGDVQAAMEIGRLLRSDEMFAVAYEVCASACVFSFIGAVHRSLGILGPSNKYARATIAIHRPFVSKPGLTLTTAQLRQFEAIVRAYVKEMNASERLVDLMLTVPPEQLRKLTSAEMNELGVIGEDRWWRETKDQAEAREKGVSRLELIRRRQEHWACIGRLPKSSPAVDEVVKCVVILGGLSEGPRP